MINTKICFKCNLQKPISDFYKHSKMKDGHLNKCKECTKSDVKNSIENNKEHYIEYEKKRANLPHRIKARSEYAKTEAGKIAGQKAKEKWTEENVIKRAASTIVGNAVRDGKIIKPLNCEGCNSTPSRLHGHHDDYNYPMTVRWLCSKCHTAWHKEHGSGING